MNNEDKIQDWQERVKASFGNEASLYQYLFETMDNFYYRYMETTVDRDLKTRQLDDHLWGAMSFEPSMMEALKAKKSPAHAGIMELAKSVPKAQGPKVRYGLFAKVDQLTPDKGKLTIISEIHWGFPQFEDQNKRVFKAVDFAYDDLTQFRKKLALKLEEACELFL